MLRSRMDVSAALRFCSGELNANNPMGSGGKLVQAFAKLQDRNETPQLEPSPAARCSTDSLLALERISYSDV